MINRVFDRDLFGLATWYVQIEFQVVLFVDANACRVLLDHWFEQLNLDLVVIA
jgi:hypothetical protein